MTGLVAINSPVLDLNWQPNEPDTGAMQIRVIADDFTSATDALPAFAQRGWGTRVVLGSQPATATAAEVWSTDTDSRCLPSPQAAARVAAWAQQWQTADILIKQFDSTLRGPVAAEVLSAWRASGRRKLIVAPAFPAAGRTTEGGVVLVHGIEVAKSEFALDPLNPVVESSVASLFAAAGQSLAVARDASDAIAKLQTCQAIVVDAVSEHDMQQIVRVALQSSDALWAGSNGLLRTLALELPAVIADPLMQFTTCAHPIIVVGSRNPKSRAQRRMAEAHGAVVLATPETFDDPEHLTAQLVEEVCQKVVSGRYDGLVVTGGETAKQIARRLGAYEITVIREVEPGIPLCVMRTPAGDLPFVTKAGGFGSDNIFIKCLESLRGAKE
jgi:uncharacterized protein YgbK (DUF1537 family)